MFIRGTVSKGMFTFEGRKSLSAPVATNTVDWKFLFFFPSILSRIVAKPAELVENLTHIIHLCINKSFNHVFLFYRTRIRDNLRKGKPNPSGGGLDFRGTASFSRGGGVVTGSGGVSGVDVGTEGFGLVGARVTRSDDTRTVSSSIKSRRVVPAFSTTRYWPCTKDYSL
jgi:hypothetical protein